MGKNDTVNSALRTCERQGEQLGYEVVEVALDKEPAGKYLRIYLDKPEGITLDDCELFHKQIQPKLEDVDYDFLEVSSPGLDRPLKNDRDFLRHRGDQVEVKLYKPLEGQKLYTGILVERTEDDVVIDTEGGKQAFPRKGVALVRLVPDTEGIEEVDLGV